MAAAFAVVTGASSAAADVEFNFEGDAATFDPATGSRSGALSAYSATVEGLTMTLGRADGAVFDIVANTGGQDGKPEAFGLRSLDPFFDMGDLPFVASFSRGLLALSIDFGDYGEDSPDTMQLQIWSGEGGTGVLLGSATADFGGEFPDFNTITIDSAVAFRSATFTAGSPGFENSVFYDNLTATVATVPEPATWALLIAGFGLAGAQLRRRRVVAQVVSP